MRRLEDRAALVTGGGRTGRQCGERHNETNLVRVSPGLARSRPLLTACPLHGMVMWRVGDGTPGDLRGPG